MASTTLTEEARTFLRHPNSGLLLGVTGVALAVRVFVGGWRATDLVVAAVILGLEPLTEWLIHVFLLHARPKTIAGRRIDLLVARKHRRHHAEPRDVDLIFVPRQVLYGALPGAVVLYAVLLRDVQLTATAVLVSYAMLTLYEWTHYLIHSRYLPKGRYYRYIWRAHRLHHYRNERYWFGVTIHLADHVLRTFPERDEVPVSPTARTLVDA
jgi:hypothetical protein